MDEHDYLPEIKECTTCSNVFHINEFPLSGGIRKDGTHRRSAKCRECKKLYDREYWAETKSTRNTQKKLNAAEIRQRNKQYVSDIKENSGCLKCPEKDIDLLEFDHINPANKTANISDLVGQCVSIETLEAEIAKCQILCVKCHRKKTLGKI